MTQLDEQPTNQLAGAAKYDEQSAPATKHPPPPHKTYGGQNMCFTLVIKSVIGLISQNPEEPVVESKTEAIVFFVFHHLRRPAQVSPTLNAFPSSLAANHCLSAPSEDGHSFKVRSIKRPLKRSKK
jgi:hypothetical protein